MRSRSLLFLAAFYVGCSADGPGERPSGAGGAGQTSSGATTSSTSGTTSTTASSGASSGTSSGSTTSSASGSSGGGSATGPGGTTGGSGGSSIATGGSGGAPGSGGSSSGGAPIDASVETGPPPPPPDPGPLSGGGAGCTDTDPTHQGRATFYTLLTATNVGTCGFMPLPTQPPYWVAMNQARFNNSTDCGACVEATGPSGTKQFIVVDECPANSTNCDNMEHIDMDQTGFGAIGGNGIINSLPWKYIACPVQGNVQIYAPSTASQFNAPITVRNHRYRIKSVEIITGTTRKSITRQSYNAWILDSTFPPGSTGMILSPFRVRITDIYGHWIENKITLMPGKSVDMSLQFPACPAGGDAGP